MIDQETGEVIGPFIRTPFNYDTKAESDATGLACDDGTKTQVQFADEVDINSMIERMLKTGEPPPMVQVPTEADFSEAISDYQTAMNQVVAVRETFMTLPAKARERFRNDPQEMMKFMADPENNEEAVKLGLYIKRPEPVQEIKPEPKPEPKPDN